MGTQITELQVILLAGIIVCFIGVYALFVFDYTVVMTKYTQAVCVNDDCSMIQDAVVYCRQGTFVEYVLIGEPVSNFRNVTTQEFCQVVS
jgi:hypothetical protein